MASIIAPGRMVLILFGLWPMLSGLTVDASVFADHMVVQRDRPVVVWGQAIAGTAVQVAMDGDRAAVMAKADGTWEARLPPRPASTAPATIIITGEGKRIELADVLVGDVWICAGQSNMEWPVAKERQAADLLTAAAEPRLRLLNHDWAGQYRFGKPHGTDEVARLRDGFFRGTWAVSSRTSAAPMSAVGWCCARMLVERTGVPIGLVNWSIGGAPIETFIARDALAAHPYLCNRVAGDWLANPALPAWVRERGHQNLDRVAAVPADDLGRDHAYKPGFAFAHGPGHWTRFPVAGVLWYQGESNSLAPQDVADYGDLFRLLVADWRRRWNRPDLPFLWVQLSAIDTRTYRSVLWPDFRDGQRRLLEVIPHGGMAVCSDYGAKDDVHPTAKREVGERLARWALRLVHGQEVIPSGPLARSAVVERDAVIVSFTWSQRLRSRDGQALREFELAGPDGIFHPSDASIAGDTVRIVSPAVPSPRQVRMGWKPWTMANLVNGEDLPASTFQLEIAAP